jgi:DNA polymerase III, delta'' subunit
LQYKGVAYFEHEFVQDKERVGFLNFESLIGQSALKKNLLNTLCTDSCAHAYLFSGPEGIGKSTFAIDFARMLLCTEDGTDACGKCAACSTFDTGANPDFLSIEPDGNSISVESIRKIQSEAIIRPMYSRRKVYFIKQAEKMTQQAQNSLLKTLEEPPLYCVIILSTHNPEMLLPTVRSRLLKYTFSKNTNQEIETILKNNKLFSDNSRFITSYAEGIPGLAIRLASSEEFSELRNEVFERLKNIMENSIKGQFVMAKYIMDNSDNIEVILNLITCFYRDLLVSRKCRDQGVLINSDKKDMIKEYCKKITSERICRIVEDIEEIRRNIRQNANMELAADVLAMRLREE